MLIPCPYCGPRDVGEFTYQGDANRVRPALDAPRAEWETFVYERVNTAGPHREHWQHSGGCRAHLTVVRDTLTHHVLSAEFVRPGPVAKAGS
ncbi:MAG: sarcosine oxidase subunit delta [Rhizobiaceae bacterium]|nr:sarcosine oxidase subunit delta [Rhizobiaceae bacterium]MCV0406594.1 sarcosine oxidase subunit delta [Rhizobiaceae bacterium]